MYVFKIIGIMLTFFSSCAYGWIKAYEYGKRTKMLKEIAGNLIVIENDIRFYNKPLYRIAERLIFEDDVVENCFTIFFFKKMQMTIFICGGIVRLAK